MNEIHRSRESVLLAAARKARSRSRSSGRRTVRRRTFPLMPKHRVLKLELADASAPTQDPDQPNKKEVDQRQHCVRDASEPR
jgi:hypothetical protein